MIQKKAKPQAKSKWRAYEMCFLKLNYPSINTSRAEMISRLIYNEK